MSTETCNPSCDSAPERMSGGGEGGDRNATKLRDASERGIPVMDVRSPAASSRLPGPVS
ncbi:hypothetical protein ACWEN4_18495 [Streptomyces violaceorubidus]